MAPKFKWQAAAETIKTEVLPYLGKGERLPRVSYMARLCGVAESMMRVDVLPALEAAHLIERQSPNGPYVKK